MLVLVEMDVTVDSATMLVLLGIDVTVDSVRTIWLVLLMVATTGTLMMLVGAVMNVSASLVELVVLKTIPPTEVEVLVTFPVATRRGLLEYVANPGKGLVRVGIPVLTLVVLNHRAP